VRMLSKGSAKVTFLVGIVLSFPGVSYLNALDHIDRLNPGPVPAILLVVFFCVMQQLLVEAPLVAYAVAPDWTPGAVSRSRAWLHRRGRSIAVYGLAAVGILLIVRGIIEFT
jgi:Sap, sulfolipid-1-addressing protein